MNIKQVCMLYELKERLELAELVRNADDERIRLIAQIISADSIFVITPVSYLDIVCRVVPSLRATSSSV